VAKLTERQLLWTTIGVSVVLSGGITALVFSDRAEIQQIEDAIHDPDAGLERRIRDADVEIRKTKDREDAVVVFREVQGREMEILPQRQQVADFHMNLTTFLTQAGASFSKIPENAPKESELARGVFVTPNTIEFTADAASLLRVVNMIENDRRLVAVKGLKVKAGQHRPGDPDGPVAHDVEMHLETYYYAPPAGKRESVQIPNYEARLEDPALRAAIAAFQPERRDSYALRPSASRRDSFVDMRRQVVVEDPAAVRRRFEAEEAVVVDLEKRIDEIREKSETEKALHQLGDLFRGDRLAQELDALLNELRVRVANVASVKSVTFPELASRVEKVHAGAEEVASGRKDLPRNLTVTLAVAENTRDMIAAAFRTGDYAEVNTLTTAWDQFLRGKAIEASAYPVIEEVKGFRRRAKILTEFQSKSIRVTGIMYDSVRPSRSVALINGKATRAGDTVENGVVLVAVTPDGADFTFQGETIHRTRDDAAGRGPEKGRTVGTTAVFDPTSAGAEGPR
jgi:hypothetical protein